MNRAAREPLRFNNSRYDFGFAPDAAAGAQDEAGVLREYLKGLCKAWDNVSVQFLEAYFRFAADAIEQHADVLAARLAPYAGLYDPKDFLFSAPKPLPRAHVHAPASGARAVAAAMDPADFLRVDFAFWLGDRVVAAQSAQSFLTPKRAKEHTDRLRLAGVDVHLFGAADLAGDRARDFSRACSARRRRSGRASRCRQDRSAPRFSTNSGLAIAVLQPTNLMLRSSRRLRLEARACTRREWKRSLAGRDFWRRPRASRRRFAPPQHEG